LRDRREPHQWRQLLPAGSISLLYICDEIISSEFHSFAVTAGWFSPSNFGKNATLQGEDMSARTTPPNKAQLHIAERYHNPYADYNAELEDLFSHAMDRALGMQKASLTAVVKMQSEVIEMQKQAYGQEPVVGNILNSASQTLATCLDIQLNWLNLMVNCAKQGAGFWFQLVFMGTIPAGDSLPETQPQMMEEEEVASIAFGVGAA
jgi:hypothetical protein